LKNGKSTLVYQERPGLHGNPFTLYKFRTMSNARDSLGDLLPDRSRITSFGKLRRSTSLDELPELIHVLKGDMSLGGLRPLLMQYIDPYTPNKLVVMKLIRELSAWRRLAFEMLIPGKKNLN
jgi:sugar transferase EpsL